MTFDSLVVYVRGDVADVKENGGPLSENDAAVSHYISNGTIPS